MLTCTVPATADHAGRARPQARTGKQKTDSRGGGRRHSSNVHRLFGRYRHSPVLHEGGRKRVSLGCVNSVRDSRRRRPRRHVVHAVRRHTRCPLLHQTVDKGKVAFKILGYILAYAVVAALLETVVDTGEAMVFEDGGNDVGDGLVLKQSGSLEMF